MITLVSIIHVTACIFLVLFVLVQSGKGAEISASFAGSSQTVFGSSGGASVFAKITGALAVVFMITSLYLTVRGNGEARNSVFDKLPARAPIGAPANPVNPALPATGAANTTSAPANSAPAQK